MVWWSKRSKLRRKLEREAESRETLDQVADHYINAALKGTGIGTSEIERIVEKLDDRQQNLAELGNTITKFTVALTIALILSTFPAEQAEILGVAIKQDTFLRFRELFLVLAAAGGLVVAVLNHLQRHIAAVQKALLRRAVPSQLYEIAVQKYRFDGFGEFFSLALFQHEPGTIRGHILPSYLLLAVSFGVLFLAISGAVLWIHLWVLTDIVQRPASPVWVSYAAVAMVIFCDSCALYWTMATTVRRRSLYTADFLTRTDQFIEKTKKEIDQLLKQRDTMITARINRIIGRQIQKRVAERRKLKNDPNA